MRRIRSNLTFANAMSLVAVFIALGGAAYAANTVRSSDIVNDEVYSADVRNDTLAGGGLARTDLRAGAVGTSEVLNDTAMGGGLAAADLRSGSVGPAEAAGLGTADLANTGVNGSDDVNANLLDGIDSTGLVHGRGSFLSNRIVFVPVSGQPGRTLLEIPGLGELRARCFQEHAWISWNNTTSSTIDEWKEAGGEWFTSLRPPGSTDLVADSDVAENRAGSIGLGLGNDPGPRRVATLDAFAFQEQDGFPCGFQAQGTLWTSD